MRRSLMGSKPFFGNFAGDICQVNMIVQTRRLVVESVPSWSFGLAMRGCRTTLAPCAAYMAHQPAIATTANPAILPVNQPAKY